MSAWYVAQAVAWFVFSTLIVWVLAHRWLHGRWPYQGK